MIKAIVQEIVVILPMEIAYLRPLSVMIKTFAQLILVIGLLDVLTLL